MINQCTSHPISQFARSHYLDILYYKIKLKNRHPRMHALNSWWTSIWIFRLARKKKLKGDFPWKIPRWNCNSLVSIGKVHFTTRAIHLARWTPRKKIRLNLISQNYFSSCRPLMRLFFSVSPGISWVLSSKFYVETMKLFRMLEKYINVSYKFSCWSVSLKSIC